MKSKHGQIGEAITWTVAIIIILGILLVTLLIISTSSWFKRNNYDSVSSQKTADILATKSLAGYLLTKDNEKTVFQQLTDDGNINIFFNDFNGNLAKNIFKRLYGQDYPSKIWLGVYSNRGFKINDYFGAVAGGSGISGISQEIKLNQSESIFMRLSK